MTTPPQAGPDAHLDLVLGHLGQAPPPAGMHARVLRNLTQQVQAQQGHVRQNLALSGQPLPNGPRHVAKAMGSLAPLTRLFPPDHTRSPFFLATAAVASCIVAVVFTHLAPFRRAARLPLHTAAPRSSPPPLGPASQQGGQGTEPTSTAIGLPSAPPSPRHSARLAATPWRTVHNSLPPSFPPPAVVRPADRPGGTVPTGADLQALDDLHAPSHPAPPLPLTAQERALLHLLHRDGSVDLAQLAPGLRAQGDQETEKTLHEYFDPPPQPQPRFEGDPQ